MNKPNKTALTKAEARLYEAFEVERQRRTRIEEIKSLRLKIPTNRRSALRLAKHLKVSEYVSKLVVLKADTYDLFELRQTMSKLDGMYQHLLKKQSIKSIFDSTLLRVSTINKKQSPSKEGAANGK
jgi:hypothetical protein